MSYFMAQGPKKYSCDRKVRHRTFADAMKAIAGTANATGDMTLVAYACEHCRFFHLGHPPPSVQKRLKYNRLLNLIDRANGR